MLFKQGQRECYVAEAVDKAAQFASTLEALRTFLSVYQHGRRQTVEVIVSMPYVPGDRLYDAFVAKATAETLEQFIATLQRIGTVCTDDIEHQLQDVDLSAAKDDGPGIPDDDAIRESYMDTNDDVPDSVHGRERDVADSAGGVTDDPLHPDEQAAHNAAVNQSMCGDREGDPKEDFPIGDDADTVGGGPVRLGMLDAEGTAADPGIVAAKNAQLILLALLHGCSSDGRTQPGLSQRLSPLIDYGEINARDIAAMVAKFHGFIGKLTCLKTS